MSIVDSMRSDIRASPPPCLRDGNADVFYGQSSEARAKSTAPERRHNFEDWHKNQDECAGTPANLKKGEDFIIRFHKPTRANADRRRDSDPVSHEQEPLPVKPAKKKTQPQLLSGSAGMQSSGSGSRSFVSGGGHTFLGGSEDLLPAGTRKCCKAELPPSEDLIRHNNIKAHEKIASTPRKHGKADLPPSEQLKRQNKVRAHETTKAPLSYTVGAMPASAEVQQMNDQKLLHGAHRPAPSKIIHTQHFQSDDMRKCLIPLVNCAMSSECPAGLSTIAEQSREHRRLAKPESHSVAETPSERRCFLKSDVSSVAETELAQSVASIGTPRERRSSAKSEASSITEASHKSCLAQSIVSSASDFTRPTNASCRSTCSESAVSIVTSGSQPTTRSETSQVSSQIVGNTSGRRRYAASSSQGVRGPPSTAYSSSKASEAASFSVFSPPARTGYGVAKGSSPGHTSRASCQSESTAYSASAVTISNSSFVASQSTRRSSEVPLSARSQSSFSFGGFDFDRLSRRSGAS